MNAVATSPDGSDPDERRRVLAAAFNLEFLPVLPAPSAAAVAVLPLSAALEFAAAPVSLAPDENPPDAGLCVALSRLPGFQAADSLRYLLRRDVCFVVAPAAEIRRIITRACVRAA